MAAHFYSRPKQRPHQRNQLTDPTWSIFVGNISYETNEQELRSFFDEACDHVSTVRIIYDNQTRQSRGFGFVQFDALIAYEMALTLNGSPLNGRKLKISPSEPKATFPSTKSSTVVAETVGSCSTNERKTHVVHCKKSTFDLGQSFRYWQRW